MLNPIITEHDVLTPSVSAVPAH